MAEGKKKKDNGIVFGIILLGASIMAIWKNEHRFDYYKAAKATAPVESIEALADGSLFSHTGPMDQGLTLKGKYVDSFEGYLQVTRTAEIYAWDRDEDDDGVSWSKEWMSSLESNERNEGLNKEFDSDTIVPSTYRISDLPIQSAKIQFVDPRQPIPPAEIRLTALGSKQGLVPRKEDFYLSKGDSDQLGDERISYRGIPVPETATYFGKWEGESAVAHQAEPKEGLISDIIQDKGILHHLVAGPRETALTSIKEHIARVKMITRIIGLVVCTIGGGTLFSSLTRILVFIPVIGPFLNQLSGWIGMLIGFVLGLITLIIAYLTSRPIILIGLGVLIIASLVLVARNATRKRKRIQGHVAGTLGHAPSPEELNELEFIQLWQLAAWNGAITPDEQAHLDQWTRRQGWTPDKIAGLTRRAEQESAATSDQQKLETLIRYSLADGRIDRKELKTLRNAATWIGVGKKELRVLMSRIQAA